MLAGVPPPTTPGPLKRCLCERAYEHALTFLRSLPFLHNFIRLGCSVLTLGSNSFYCLFHVSEVILALCGYAVF